MQSNNLFNIEIERATLSAIIFDESIFEDIASLISSNDFYLQFHKNVFDSMLELSSERKPLDHIFIQKKLESNNNFNEIFMLDILSANPISDISHYINEIKNMSAKRLLISLATTIRQKTIEENLEVSSLMDIVEKKLYQISENNSNQSDFKTTKDITSSILEEIQRLKELNNSKLIGIDTGFRNLNSKTNGFAKGDLVIIAARPSMGKTALALNMALKAMERGEGVVFFSLEMSAEQLMLRILSIKTSIPLQNLRVGDMDDEQWINLTNSIKQVSKYKLFVDDSGSLTIHQTRSKLRKLKKNNPDITMSIIDYLQLMNGDGRAKESQRQQEISDISRGLKQLARELEIPILALSQLNRGLESRDNKRPFLSDLRESGSIEQDADIVMFVYRDDVYREAKEKEKEMKAKSEGKKYENSFEFKLEEDVELIIGKNRNGPTGTVKLIFQKKYTRFEDIDNNENPYDIEDENDNNINMNDNANIDIDIDNYLDNDNIITMDVPF